METQAFGVLCALACVTFTATAQSPRQLWAWLAGCGVGLLLINPGWLGLPLAPLLAIEPAQTALLIFLLAFARLRNAALRWPLHAGAGLLAVLWLFALVMQGYPLPLAWLQVALLSALTWLATLRRPAFCSPVLLEDALLLVMAGALALAIVPEVLAGWRAAEGLQTVGGGEAADTGNRVGLLVAAGFGLLGSIYAMWKDSLRAGWKAG